MFVRARVVPDFILNLTFFLMKAYKGKQASIILGQQKNIL